jgi:hypothetical protein
MECCKSCGGGLHGGEQNTGTLDVKKKAWYDSNHFAVDFEIGDLVLEEISPYPKATQKN